MGTRFSSSGWLCPGTEVSGFYPLRRFASRIEMLLGALISLGDIQPHKRYARISTKAKSNEHASRDLSRPTLIRQAQGRLSFAYAN